MSHTAPPTGVTKAALRANQACQKGNHARKHNTQNRRWKDLENLPPLTQCRRSDSERSWRRHRGGEHTVPRKQEHLAHRGHASYFCASLTLIGFQVHQGTSDCNQGAGSQATD